MSSIVYKIITDRIIEELRSGVIPWEKPWVNGTCSPRGYEMAPGECYKGVNRLLLPYEGEYLTKKMVDKYGGRIKDMSRSFIVTYLAQLGRRRRSEEETEGEELTDDGRRCLMYYRVFHISNVEGVPSRVKTRRISFA